MCTFTYAKDYMHRYVRLCMDNILIYVYTCVCMCQCVLRMSACGAIYVEQ